MPGQVQNSKPNDQVVRVVCRVCFLNRPLALQSALPNGTDSRKHLSSPTTPEIVSIFKVAYLVCRHLCSRSLATATAAKCSAVLLLCILTKHALNTRSFSEIECHFMYQLCLAQQGRGGYISCELPVPFLWPSDHTSLPCRTRRSVSMSTSPRSSYASFKSTCQIRKIPKINRSLRQIRRLSNLNDFPPSENIDVPTTFIVHYIVSHRPGFCRTSVACAVSLHCGCLSSIARLRKLDW